MDFLDGIIENFRSRENLEIVFDFVVLNFEIKNLEIGLRINNSPNYRNIS